MTTKLLSILFSAILSVIPAFANAKDWTQMNFGVEGDFPPWSSIDPKGQASGLAIDLIHEFCRRAKLDCIVNVVSWDSLIPSLKNNKFDAIMNVGINDKRKEVIDFSIPYVISPASFIILRSGSVPELPKTGAAAHLDDKASTAPILEQAKTLLAGKTVGVVRSSSHEQMINAFFADVTSVRSYTSSPERDLDLKSGRIDVAFDNAVYGATELARVGNEDMALSGPLFDGAPLATQVAIGFRKGEEQLAIKFNVAIKEAIQDGTIKKLSEKWTTLDLTPHTFSN